MNKNIKFFGVLLLLNCSMVFGQTPNSTNNLKPTCVQYQETKLKKFNSDSKTIKKTDKDSDWNTFEFISLDGKKEVFSKKIIPMLEDMRKENEDVFYQISEHSKIKILPKSVINSDEFKNSIK